MALGIAVSITVGAISWIHLFAAALLQGLVMALMMPARQALIYELVGENTLMNAIALNAAAMNFIRLMAPAFAGFFIALWSIEGVYYIMTVLYVIGFMLAVRLPFTGTDRLMHFLWDAYAEEGHKHHGFFLEHFKRIGHDLSKQSWQVGLNPVYSSQQKPRK